MSAGGGWPGLLASLIGAVLLHGLGLWLVLARASMPGAVVADTMSIGLDLARALVIDGAAAGAGPQPMPSAPSGGARDRQPAKAAKDKKAGKDAKARKEGKETARRLSAAKQKKDARRARHARRKAMSASQRETGARRPGGKRRAVRRVRRRGRAAAAGGRGGLGHKAALRAASAGTVRSYAALVRAQVARWAPASATRRGKVVVIFALTPAGGLRYSRIGRSSGVPALDRMALAAVHRAAPFPRPPRDMTARQRRFRIPFLFR